MSDYPSRGEMSKDGKYYTSTNGNVYEHGKRKIEGAYVPTDEEREACDMAREMIALCSDMADCDYCLNFEKKSCPARAYMAAHGCAEAWEVKP